MWRRIAIVLLAGLETGVLFAQRIKAVFGLLEGGGDYPITSGIFYSWEGSRGSDSFLGMLPDVEPYGNDLAYDPKTKLLFVIGGSREMMAPWRGSVYALDIWRSLIPLSTRLDGIGARRIAVRDTLLLVTRSRSPYFTAYRIAYDAQQRTLSLDSLWSPEDARLRNLPDALLLWGDTAFVGITYNPNPTTYAPDSLVLAINLRTRQVVGSWTVHPNPTELVRIKDSLYVACAGNFGDNLRIARIVPSQSIVQIWDAGYVSYGGFVTDTGGVKDTILFWSSDNVLRAFDVRAGQTASDAYLGIASSGPPFSSYALLWVGRQLWMTFTNYTDTSLIIVRDTALRPNPPHLDTLFRTNYPSPRRLIYVEDDTSRGRAAALPTLTSSSSTTFWYDLTKELLFWKSELPLHEVAVLTLLGQVVLREEGIRGSISIAGMPTGMYVAIGRSSDGSLTTYRFWKP